MMVLAALLLMRICLSVLDSGIFAGLLAFSLSRPGRLVSVTHLGLGVLAFVILYDFVMYTIVAPLDLTLTTGNPHLVGLLGSPDLSDVFQPSFGVLDIGFYAIDVVVGTCFGKFLVIRYYRRHDFPTNDGTNKGGDE